MSATRERGRRQAPEWTPQHSGTTCAGQPPHLRSQAQGPAAGPPTNDLSRAQGRPPPRKIYPGDPWAGPSTQDGTPHASLPGKSSRPLPPVSPRTLGSTHVAFGCSQDSFPGAPRQPLGVPLPFELLHQEIKGLPLTGGDENLIHQCRHR